MEVATALVVGIGALVSVPLGWLGFVHANLAVARFAPERLTGTRVVAGIPRHLRGQAFEDEEEGLAGLGFRPLGAVRARAFLWTIASRVAWNANHGVFSSTFSFARTPRTLFVSVLDDGTLVHTGFGDEPAPEQRGAVVHQAREGTSAERFRAHLDLVVAIAGECGLDRARVDPSLAGYSRIDDLLGYNQLRPSVPRRWQVSALRTDV